MKLTLIISIILLGLNVYSQQVIDKIVAQVGDKVILKSDIEIQKLQMLQGGLPVDGDIDGKILEELLYQNLLLNQAKLDSVVVSPEQVNAEMENRLRVIEGQIGGRQKMEEFYGQTVAQIKVKFRAVIHDQLLSQEMERTITADLSITPAEVEAFYNSLPLDSIPLINSQLSFQQIVIYPDITEADKNIAKQKLIDIRTKIIDNNKRFSTQARIHSMDPGSAKEGGQIEATRGMMVPQFEAAVFSLKPGEVSDVFETTYGYHIVKLVERRGDDYTCQHILIIPEFSSDAIGLAASRMDSCFNQLNNNDITWEQAVKIYSNDDATKRNKGIITNPITGEQTWSTEDLNQVDQQIYLLTDRMEEGEISQPNLYLNPFERKQGVRIVRLMQRRSPHKANIKDDYSLIKGAAEADKKQQIISKWIDSKINNAYIRIDADLADYPFRNNWLK